MGERNFCPLAEAKPRRPARPEQNPAQKFSFPFRRKKSDARKSKIVKKTFLRGGEFSERRRGEATIAQNPNSENWRKEQDSDLRSP